jgi:ribosomal protein L44E
MCRFFKNKEQRADEAKLRAWIHSESDSNTSKPWWISDLQRQQRREDETIGGEYGDTPEWSKQNKKIIRNQTCPYCYSNKIIDAGYGSRMKCRNCGRVFS